MSEKLTDNQKQMVEDNIALAIHIAKRYFSKTDYIKNQDIMQEAIFAMIKAVPRFDPEKAKFSTFLFPTIDGHLKRFVGYRDRMIPIPHQKHLKKETLEKADNAKTIFSLDKKIKTNYTNEDSTLMDIISGNENIEEEIVNKVSIANAIYKLQWKEKIIIIYRYYFDLSQADIGYLMSISQVHCHRLEKRALSKMRKNIVDIKGETL